MCPHLTLQASEAEQALVLLRFRIGDLLSEVAWAVNEGAGDDGRGGEDLHAGQALQLGSLVDSLVRTVRRLIRKWHRLSARLGEQPMLLPPSLAAGPAGPSWSSGRPAGVQDSEQPAASASGSDGAASSGGGWGESVAHEAGVKAARIAAALDRMLTPHSRAAAHGDSGIGVLGSTIRFATEAADADDIPLRQRYGRQATGLLDAF